jgi:hypothetical protein
MSSVYRQKLHACSQVATHANKRVGHYPRLYLPPVLHAWTGSDPGSEQQWMATGRKCSEFCATDVLIRPSKIACMQPNGNAGQLLRRGHPRLYPPPVLKEYNYVRLRGGLLDPLPPPSPTFSRQPSLVGGETKRDWRRLMGQGEGLQPVYSHGHPPPL